MRTTSRGKVHAVGYLRVSTEQQAQEGISLDAQRAKIRAYCLAQDIELVAVYADEGVSAKSLRRPGLQRALRMLTDEKADALIVAKLDRLSRNVKDMAIVCEFYFQEGRPWCLLSVSDLIDTRSAAGKLVLNVIMSAAQWEHDAMSERTQAAMAELRRQGVALGGAPYGWRYAPSPDETGRRPLVEVPEEQHGIRRICELYDADLCIHDMCRALEAEGIPSRCRCWHRRTIYRVLERAGYGDTECRRKSEPSSRERRAALRKAVMRNRDTAMARAVALRAEGLSLRKVADQLHRERILPPRSDAWHAAGILDLLRLARTVTKRPSPANTGREAAEE